LEVRNLAIDGDLIPLHFSVTGTHRGSFKGTDATGRRVTISQFTVYRVEDQKFADVWDLADMDADRFAGLGGTAEQFNATAHCGRRGT
jgi:predicted ester cyclase